MKFFQTLSETNLFAQKFVYSQRSSPPWTFALDVVLLSEYSSSKVFLACVEGENCWDSRKGKNETVLITTLDVHSNERQCSRRSPNLLVLRLSRLFEDSAAPRSESVLEDVTRTIGRITTFLAETNSFYFEMHTSEYLRACVGAIFSPWRMQAYRRTYAGMKL